MTATAAAPASGPIAPIAPRAAPPAATDRFAFAAMLDSLPGAETKTGSSIAGDGSPTSNEQNQRESSLGQPAFHSMLYDGAFLSSLPFALPSAPASHEGPAAAADASLLAPASMIASMLEDSGASNATYVEPANSTPAGRLVGERAFHLSASTSGGVIAEGPRSAGPPAAASEGEGAPVGPSSLAPLSMQGPVPANDGATSAVGGDGARVPAGASLIGERVLLAGLSPAGGAVARHLANAASSGGETLAPAPIALPVNGTSANPSAGMTRAAAQNPANGGRKSQVATSPPVARLSSSAALSVAAEPSSKPADGPPPDPSLPTGQSAAPGGAFGALPSSSLGPYDLPAEIADVAPRASTLSANPTSAAPPIKEIDVDLSPGGLENVSMTMRLAGDKLSVVIRAASSQTSGSIERARDAIVDRLAAIGQPLNSLIIQQVGVNADANTNGNAASDEGSTAGERQSGQSAGEQHNSNDPSASRRGASGDLRF